MNAKVPEVNNVYAKSLTFISEAKPINAANNNACYDNLMLYVKDNGLQFARFCDVINHVYKDAKANGITEQEFLEDYKKYR